MKQLTAVYFLTFFSFAFILETLPMNAQTLKFKPFAIENLEPRPPFWRVRPDEIIERCRTVTRGRSEIIATTPGGFPVYAVFYGDFSENPPQTNWSAGASSSSWKAYAGEQQHPQTILFLAGVHGSEAESVAAAINLIQLLETGKDYRGKEDAELVSLAAQYRLIIVPCLNMDGRSISPDHLRNVPFEQFRASSQGTWKDGSLIGWRGSKEYFPLPLERVSYPGGYPNFNGINIMHDATPGDIRSDEARGLLRTVARWRVDLLLNGHSCEYASSMISPSAVNYPRNVERGLDLVAKVNEAFFKAGLRPAPVKPPKATSTMNLNNMASMASGCVSLTLECSVSCDKPSNPTVTYSFEQLMEPNFIMLKTIMKDGLATPFLNRSAF